MLPMLVMLVVVVAAFLLLIFPFIGIYHLLVSPIIQWGLLIALVIVLLSNKKVQQFLHRFIRFK